MYEIKEPVITKRNTNEKLYSDALCAGATHLQSLIIANRNLPDGTDIYGFMNPSLDNIPNIGLLQDIHKAGNRIADAIINKEYIALACDFDVDGISSSAVLYKALIDLFYCDPFRIHVCISNRMNEGYGFTDKVVKRLTEYEDLPSLVITADQGSSNAKEINMYIDYTKKEIQKPERTRRINMIADVIVSDHHEISKEEPVNAFAFVNPQRKTDKFPDKTICGCTVAMFLMAATRAALIKKGYLKKDESPIKPLMGYSTAATISDCVSMASSINRAIVQNGLKEINDASIPAWSVLKKNLNNKDAPIKAETIAFGLGPMINACSRTGGDGLNAVRYYLSETDAEAQRYYSMLTVDNTLRKEIELRLVEEATQKAEELIRNGYHSIVVPIKNGHHGIHGIAASRIVERYGRPTILLSPKETHKEEITKEDAELLIGGKIAMSNIQEFYDIPNSNSFVSTEKVEDKGRKKKLVFYKETVISMSGSGRSIDGLGEDQKGDFNLLGAMINANDKYDIFLGFGGHHMAAGMGLNVEKVKTLRKGIEEEVKSKISFDQLYPKVWTDGYLPDGYSFNDALMDEIDFLEPYGRQFDYPSFTVDATVMDFRPLSDGKHAKLTLNIKNQVIDGIWFKYHLRSDVHSILNVGKALRFVVSPKYNYYNGKRTIQLFINHAEEI